MEEAAVFIILLNYRNVNLTIDCIKSINESSYDNYKIIVVDNASNDDSVRILRECRDIILIESQENLGFSGGCNLGIRYALEHHADYIMLLNNDTIVDQELIKKLVNNTQKGTVTVPKIYYFPVGSNEIWYAGGKLTKFKTDSIQYGLNAKEDGISYEEEKCIDFCCGCCFMISSIDIKEVGLLAEEYFLYCEDNDFSIRLKKNNISVRYIPTANLWHKVSASTNGENSKFVAYYVTRNRLYCAKKNKLGLLAELYIMLESFLRYIKSYINSNKAYRIALVALKDCMCGKMGKSQRDLL